MTKKELKEKRINDILDAAVSEFVEKGYENASMDSIAERAGITKGGVYYHFASKDQMLVMANERFMQPVMEMMAAALASPSPCAGLWGYIQAYLGYWNRNRRELSFIFLSMTKAMGNPALSEAYKNYTAPVIAFFEGLLRAAGERGEIRAVDYRASALCLMSALDGALGYLALDSSLTLEGVAGDIRETFLSGTGR